MANLEVQKKPSHGCLDESMLITGMSCVLKRVMIHGFTITQLCCGGVRIRSMPERKAKSSCQTISLTALQLLLISALAAALHN